MRGAECGFRFRSLHHAASSSSSSCLKRMAGELQGGEWAIWGALAKQQLASASSEKLDISSYAELIRRCACFHSLSDGRKLHWELRTAGMDQHRYLGNLLIQMYGNCKSVPEAKGVFDNIRERNLYSWNIMLVTYTQNGHLQRARELFDRMPEPNVVTWNTIHSAYAQAGDMEDARNLFERIPERDPVSWNTMIVAYAQEGHLEGFRSLFNEMPVRNLVSWNAIIAAYTRLSKVAEAREALERMPLHNVISWNTLISAYIEKDDLVEASKLFTASPERDAVSWTALITGYSEQQSLEKARYMFDRMPLKDLVSWTAMITGYSRNGCLEEARSLLDNLKTYDSGCWNAMITGYVENGEGRQALHLFKLMDLEGVPIDKVAFFNALDAAICIANMEQGREVHSVARDTGFIVRHTGISNSLINMYSKCGSVESAQGVFDEMQERNLVSWNAIISCYTRNGDPDSGVEMFRLMIADGLEPDEIAFVTALSGCSHGGLLRSGWQFFDSIQQDFGQEPSADHYACMVDLLGRVGHLNEAEELVVLMPYEPQALAWRSLLAACKVQGDVVRGARLARHLTHQIDVQGPSSNYVLICNVFSAAGDEAEEW